MKTIKFFLITLLFFNSAICYSSTPIYVFTNKNELQRFQTLTQNLRCLVCQNESLADSSAALASDLRLQIAKFINSGQTDKQIIHYLVTRYGDFILYKPPFMLSTLILWLAPFFLVVLSLLGLCCRIVYLKQKNKSFALTAEERLEAQKILENKA